MANRTVYEIKKEFDIQDDNSDAYNCTNITDMTILEVIAESLKTELDMILKSTERYKCRNLSTIFFDNGVYSHQKELLKSLIDPNQSKYLNNIMKNELKSKLVSEQSYFDENIYRLPH